MAYRKLGRDNKHRRSMLATLTKQVVMNESITTTDTRAKEVRKFVDKMITYGKKGDLNSRRLAAAVIRDVWADEANRVTALKKLFDEIAPSYKDRNGGYTRVLKIANRRGDNAPMAIVSLVK